MIKKIIQISIFVLFSISIVNAQTKETKKQIIKETNVKALQKMSKASAQKYKINKALALKTAKEKGWLIKGDKNGVSFELQGITKNGKPIYYTTQNADAAATISTNKVYSGGGLGLNLDGTDMIVGEWDQGDILTTHQEFNNTGVSRVIDKDGVGGTSYHSTHVAGTLIAGGVDPTAKGMAYNATLHDYDWNNDASEMATAASDGLLISNHSYGHAVGWYWNGMEWAWLGDESISTEEDYLFGFYDSYAAELDEIAYNAPYYLIVKAAGNDLNDGNGQTGHPADGANGYDCIPNKGNAKNILTVGSVSDLEYGYIDPSHTYLSDYSSTGPCDDSRIKPDIVTNGDFLRSTSNGGNSSYGSLRGTSMASPSAAGSLLLLQEHYFETQASYMKSATLKALVIHTADECGDNIGPDYKFGWGLMNTAKAANVISGKDLTSFIKEETYTGTDYVFIIKANGNSPLKATIVWTDPKGTPPLPSLDPEDAMLINDLDMTISGFDNTYYPYKLTASNPSAAATTGDNNVDNVEQIVIANPEDGYYTITINHDGIITGGTQDFSLIVTGIESTDYPAITTNPAGGTSLTSAVLGGNISLKGASDIVERGVVWSLTENPVLTDNRLIDEELGIGNYSVHLIGLSPETTYHFRAYAVNSHGISYGMDKSFTTNAVSFFFDDFETDKGWTMNGEWERGTPQGLQGDIYGSPDPDVAFEGTNILGLDLSTNGDYNGNIADRGEYAISPVIDCSNYEDVKIKFQRWLGVESNNLDHAYIDISTDGANTWNEIWANDNTIMPGGAWEEITHDISAYADGQATVQIRFSIGTTDDSWNYCGWNIDNFYFTGTSTVPVVFTEAISGCNNSGSVEVYSNQSENQTFYLLDNAGTILQNTTADASFYKFTGLTNGTYKGKIEGSGGMSEISNIATLTNNEATIITSQPQNINATIGDNVSFSVTADNAIGYQWQFEGIDILGADEATYTISNAQNSHSGNYNVVVFGNCGDIISDVVALSFGASVETLSENEINISPNPTSGIFTINLEAFSRPLSVSKIEITDITGKTIKQLSIDNYQLSIDLTNQPTGIYFIKVQTDKNIIIKKIIKD